MDANKWAATLRRQAREVATLQGAQAAEFMRLLKELRLEMIDRIAAIPPGRGVDAFFAQKVLTETEKSLSDLAARAKDGFVGAQVEAAEVAVEHLSDSLGSLSKTFGKGPVEVGLKAAKVLADPSQKLLADHFESSVQTYGEQALNSVRQRIFIGMRAGDTVGDIARDLGGEAGPLGESTRAEADRLVRTEVSQAYGAAKAESIRTAARKVEGLRQTWIKLGSQPCKICDPLHGTERPLGGTWTVPRSKVVTIQVAHPPAHPNCLPGWTLIETPSGKKRIDQIVEGDEVLGGLTGQPRRVTRLHVNDFDGHLIRLVSDELEISLTANHPVLSDGGWVAAESVDVGTHLFRCVCQPRMPNADGLARPANKRPSVVEQIDVPGSVNAALAVAVVPPARVNLDGNPLTQERDVDVVDAFNVLNGAWESESLERGHGGRLKFGGSGLFADTASSLGLLGVGLDTTTRGVMGSLRALGSLLRGVLRCRQSQRLGASTPSETGLAHPVVDDGPGNPASGSNVLDAFIADPVKSPQFHGVEFYPVHVRSILHVPYRGKVYNLTVDTDESYVANSIVAHNCACSVIASRPDWTEAMQKLGYLEPVVTDDE